MIEGVSKFPTTTDLGCMSPKTIAGVVLYSAPPRRHRDPSRERFFPQSHCMSIYPRVQDSCVRSVPAVAQPASALVPEFPQFAVDNAMQKE